MKVCSHWTQSVQCAVIKLLDIVQTSILTIRASRIFPWRRPAQLNRISPPRVGDGLSSGTHWHTTVDMAIKPSRLRACSFWKFKQVITLPFMLFHISFFARPVWGSYRSFCVQSLWWHLTLSWQFWVTQTDSSGAGQCLVWPWAQLNQLESIRTQLKSEPS